MNIVGLYGGTGFVGNYFQSMLRSSNDNTHVQLIPHRGSNKEIKEALKKLDTFGPEESNRSIIYLAENNVISEADINKKEYVKQNLDRLNFVLSNTNCKIIYASSVSVYGDLSLTPHHPNDKLIATNTYTYSKLECEKLVIKADGIIARLSNMAIMILEAANITECKVEESQHSNATSCISLDISKTIETFKWTPSIRLKDGLRELV
jgi:nucleoside-diphosphate-sugar epimerase